MSKHTKGPWTEDVSGYIDNKDGDLIARNMSGAANGRLIAAAPELLEALIAFAEYFEADFEQPPEYHKAVKAIARANGNE